MLRGRSRDEPDKILATTKQDVEVALRQMQRAYSPSQLAAAEQVVARAIRRGEHSFYLYKEDVFTGGDRTITGVKGRGRGCDRLLRLDCWDGRAHAKVRHVRGSPRA